MIKIENVNRIAVLLLFQFFVLLSTCCYDGDNSSMDVIEIPNIPYFEGCVEFQFEELEILATNENYVITNSLDFIINFKDRNEAELAMNIIEYYEFDEYCSVGVNPDYSFQYFLSQGQIPEDNYYFSEDCVDFDISNLEVEQIPSGAWVVVERTVSGGHRLFASETEDEANHFLDVVISLSPFYTCFVGRPHTKMQYFKR